MAHLNAAPADTTASVYRCGSCRDHYHSEDGGPGLCPICNPAEQARDHMLRLLIAVGGGWAVLQTTGSLGWLFAALGAALVVYGVTLAAAVASGAWFRRR